MHPYHIQGLCSDPSQCRAFTQNIHRSPCLRRPVLFSSCAVHTADGCARLGVASTTSNISCPVCVCARHACWLVPYPSQTFHSVCFLFQFKAGSGKGSRLANPLLTHSFTNLYVVSLCYKQGLCSA